MTHRHRTFPLVLAIAGALAGCQASLPAVAPAPVAAPPAASAANGNGTITITPRIKQGGTRQLMAVVTPYDQADVNHLGISLFSVNGGIETLVATDDVLNADLADPLTFTNLKNDTTYRIRAYAYKAAGTLAADKISDDASSYVDLAVARDDRPVLGNLVVQLIDKTFSGEATNSGLTVVPGGFSYPGAESISH